MAHERVRRELACETDGLGDWRIHAASRLAKHLPAAFPGGPTHDVGSPVHLTTTTSSGDRRIGFVTPNAAALALNIALKSSLRANEQYTSLVFRETLTPDGPGQTVGFPEVAALYDYFEECLTVVVFSLQSLEAFSNYTIAQSLKGKYSLKRGKDVRLLGAEELERAATTEEKLGTILPGLLSLPSPKGKAVWGAFQNLKRVRDASVHLKSRDQYPHPDDQHDSLFEQFLLNADVQYFVRAAINMIAYFSRERIPRWLRGAAELSGLDLSVDR